MLFVEWTLSIHFISTIFIVPDWLFEINRYRVLSQFLNEIELTYYKQET